MCFVLRLRCHYIVLKQVKQRVGYSVTYNVECVFIFVDLQTEALIFQSFSPVYRSFIRTPFFVWTRYPYYLSSGKIAWPMQFDSLLPVVWRTRMLHSTLSLSSIQSESNRVVASHSHTRSKFKDLDSVFAHFG